MFSVKKIRLPRYFVLENIGFMRITEAILIDVTLSRYVPYGYMARFRCCDPIRVAVRHSHRHTSRLCLKQPCLAHTVQYSTPSNDTGKRQRLRTHKNSLYHVIWSSYGESIVNAKSKKDITEKRQLIAWIVYRVLSWQWLSWQDSIHTFDCLFSEKKWRPDLSENT